MRNLASGDEDAFILFDDKQALLEGGDQVINLPALAPCTYALLDYYSLGFRAACTDERVPLADQAWVRQWLARFEVAIELARVVLGMGGIAGA